MKREWLIEARKAHKMTQAEIADKVGVARQTYLRYESGERTPNAQIALILEVILGVPKEANPTTSSSASVSHTSRWKTSASGRRRDSTASLHGS